MSPTPRPGVTGVRVAAALGLTAVAAVALAACTSSGSGTGAKPSSSAAASVVPASIAPTSPQHPIPSENQIVDVPELRKTVLLTGCAASDGGWSGTGTAENKGSAAATYRVLVFFTDQYSRTIDSATTEVEVGAGKTATWTAKADFDPPAGTQCVLRGVSTA